MRRNAAISACLHWLSGRDVPNHNVWLPKNTVSQILLSRFLNVSGTFKMDSNCRLTLYWWRRATIGSTRMARRAGMNEAKRPTAQSRMATPENVTASVLVTPSNMLFK
jgi:hypothetical protein